MSLDHAFFYKSVDGDRVYDDTSFEHWLKKFFTSGVFLNDLQVTANDDMTVTVGAGYTNIDGKVKIFESATPLIIETAGASYPRIDSVVLERNDTERDIILKVVKGGYSSEPVTHTPVRQDGVYQLVIAQVLVNAGAVKVTQADITDTRSNTELCGIVAGAVDQIDFSQIQAQFNSYFAQYKAQIAEDYTQYNEDMETYLDQMAEDFSAWFEGIRNQLDEDAAGHLQNQIDDIKEEMELLGGSMVEVNVDEGEYNAEGLEVDLEIDGKIYTETIINGKVVFTGVLEVGTAKITCVDEAQEFNAETSIDIPYYGAYECSMKGGNSFKNWLEAGGLNPSSYESLDALLEDEKAVRTLMTKKDSVDVLTRMSVDDLATIINHRYAAKWINYREYAYSTLSDNADIKALMDASGMYGMYITMKEPEALVPTLSSDDGNVLGSGCYKDYALYKAFNGTNNDYGDSWNSSGDGTNFAYIGYNFGISKVVSEIYIQNRNDTSARPIKSFMLQGSDDLKTWYNIEEFNVTSSEANAKQYFTVSNKKSYKAFRIFVTQVYDTTYVGLGRLQFYGYQEGDTLWQPKGLVPVMTSNTAPYGEVIYNSLYTPTGGSMTYAGYCVFDENDNTAWAQQESTANGGGCIGYKFTNPTKVNKVYIVGGLDSQTVTAKIQYSDNGSDWKDAQDNIIFTKYGEHTFDVSESDYHLYWRLYYVSSTNATRHATTKLQFYGRQLEALIPPMTSNTAPIGEASASSTLTAGNDTYYPYMAFDKNTASAEACWISTSGSGSWLQYQFTKAVTVNTIEITNRYRSDNKNVYAPKEFIVQGSNNGSSWTNLATLTNAKTDSAVKHSYEFENNTAYTYYRLLFNSVYGASNIAIGELQMYGTPDHESRTYIYEHGVELMELEIAGTATKEADELVSSVSNGAAIVFTYTDLTDYKLIRGVCGSELIMLLNMAYCTNKPSTSSFSEDGRVTISPSDAVLPDLINLDISNVNGSYYVTFGNKTSNTQKSTLEEWWLE